MSLALKAALERHNVAGEIVLLGTPGKFACVKIPLLAPGVKKMSTCKSYACLQQKKMAMGKLSSLSAGDTREWTLASCTYGLPSSHDSCIDLLSCLVSV